MVVRHGEALTISDHLTVWGDDGNPVSLGAGPAAEAFRALADHIFDEAIPPSAMAGCSARMLDAAVAALDDANL